MSRVELLENSRLPRRQKQKVARNDRSTVQCGHLDENLFGFVVLFMYINRDNFSRREKPNRKCEM